MKEPSIPNDSHSSTSKGQQNPPNRKPFYCQAEEAIKDGLEYGLDYGIEEGIETGLASGPKAGIKAGLESAVVNGVEEAVEGALSDAIPPGDKFYEGENAEIPPKKNLKKRLIFWGKIILTLTVLTFIAGQLWESADEFRKYHWDLRPAWLILSSLFYLAAFFPAAVFWFLSLKWMGQVPSFYQAVKAFYFSQLGKYVPGKAMVVVIRSGMVAGKKVKASVAAVCVFYETLNMMATGAFLSALIVLIFFGEHWKFSLLALAAMFASGIPLLPPVFLGILRLLRLGKNDPALQEELKKITWRSLLAGMGLMTLLWILFGLSLWAAIHGIGIMTGDFLGNMPRFISVTALAIVLGFAVPISPGGLGIREAVLAILLIPYFEFILQQPENQTIHLRAETLSLVVSLEQRIVSILSELVLVGVFFVASLCSRIFRKRGGQTANEE